MCDLRFVRGGLLLEFPPCSSALPVECHNCNLGGGLPLEFPPVAAFCERGTFTHRDTQHHILYCNTIDDSHEKREGLDHESSTTTVVFFHRS